MSAKQKDRGRIVVKPELRVLVYERGVPLPSARDGSLTGIGKQDSLPSNLILHEDALEVDDELYLIRLTRMDLVIFSVSIYRTGHNVEPFLVLQPAGLQLCGHA